MSHPSQHRVKPLTEHNYEAEQAMGELELAISTDQAHLVEQFRDKNKDDEAKTKDPFKPDPTSRKEAMESDERCEWQSAEEKEMTAHKDNETWTLVPKPKSQKTLPSKWVYQRKRKDGTEYQKKARLVVLGCNQKFPSV